MEPTMQWFSKLKRLFSNSLLVSNVAFGFILIGLEKLVEMEFECPCSPTWNRLLSSLFFIVPTIMAFILMLIIQGCKDKEFILKFIAQGCKCDEFILKSITERCSCDESTLKLITQGCSCDESKFTFNMQGCRCGKSKFTQEVKRDEWFKKIMSSFLAAFVWLTLLFLDGQYFACAMIYWNGRFVLIDKAAPQKWCEPISEGNLTTQELMLRSQEWIAMSQVIGMSLLLIICVGLTVYLIRECSQEKKKPRFRMVPGTPPETTYTAHRTQVCAETHTLEIS